MATTTKSRKQTTRKTAASAKASGKKTTRPVTLHGKPAKNRHFRVDRTAYDKAAKRAARDKVLLSDVARAGILEYAAGAPEDFTGLVLLPEEAVETLREVWTAGPSARINEYFAALTRAGWPVRAIAESMVNAGIVDKISRQAVSLRVLKAPDRLTYDFPPIPALGPRRKIISSKHFDEVRKSPDEVHDMSFRVTDEDYAAAARRARSEGAMVSQVLEEFLVRYGKGKVKIDVLLAAEAADN